MSNLFVTLMGMGTVFIGLICIILICVIMGLVFKIFGKSSETTATAAPVAAPAAAPVSANQPIPDKQKLVAAACVTIAEELGTDVTNIRVVSFKRV